MNSRINRLATLALAGCCCHVAAAATAPAVTSPPPATATPPAAPAVRAAAPAPAADAVVIEQGGKPLLHFDDGEVVTRDVGLSPGWAHVVVSARMRLSQFIKGPEEWHGAQIGMRFLDDKGDLVGPNIPSLGLPANADWTPQQVTLEVPAGARTLQLEPGLWGSRGAFEVDGLSVRGIAGPSQEGTDAVWPVAEKVRWGDEVVEKSPAGETLSLNGLWRFLPSTGREPAAKGWGYLRVPGSWTNPPDLAARGTGPDWAGFNPAALAGGWYERSVTVPAGWVGRNIALRLGAVSDPAAVSVDGHAAGTIAAAGGIVTITDLLKPGQQALLRIYVGPPLQDAPTPPPASGPAPGSSRDKVYTHGLTGAVALMATGK